MPVPTPRSFYHISPCAESPIIDFIVPGEFMEFLTNLPFVKKLNVSHSKEVPNNLDILWGSIEVDTRFDMDECVEYLEDFMKRDEFFVCNVESAYFHVISDEADFCPICKTMAVRIHYTLKKDHFLKK